ncbi:hypothetical protein EDB89DRAFT_1910071 [Lactarius sanguifluus]|nr:hypothetical protein EDB89DRAFT_1910071 [Lactarius sanguifluus]
MSSFPLPSPLCSTLGLELMLSDLGDRLSCEGEGPCSCMYTSSTFCDMSRLLRQSGSPPVETDKLEGMAIWASWSFLVQAGGCAGSVVATSRSFWIKLVFAATVVVSRSRSSTWSSPCGHRAGARGLVVAASLHRSSSSLPLPPRIDMVAVVARVLLIIITESTEVAELPVVDDGLVSGVETGVVGVEDEVGVDEAVELVELVEGVLDVDELYEELKIEEDDELEAIKLESEETCGDGVGEGGAWRWRGESTPG